jgi:hypothetical protein
VPGCSNKEEENGKIMLKRILKKQESEWLRAAFHHHDGKTVVT